MSEIHPEFCSERLAWTWGDLEAKTIRELLEKSPPGTTVRDYFPDGRAVSPEERGCVAGQSRFGAYSPRPRVEDTSWRLKTPSLRRLPAETTRVRVQRQRANAVLEMWASGLAASTIAERLGMRVPAVTSIVGYARKCGDPRAVYARERGGSERRAAA